MKVCIKRGANQIGGSAVEFTATNGARIIVDLGLPLDAETNTSNLLPNIRGLQSKTDDLLAILISHPHQDHYGLCGHIDENIPVYMGVAAQKIMQASVDFKLPSAVAFKTVHTFTPRTPFEIGPFKITPYLVDHSAYDAYAFLIEADGRRVLYSGDFRAHGRKSKLYDAFIKKPPRDIDVLLMEGSCLGRERADKYETESDLEMRFTDTFKSTRGVSMVMASSQNIDRIVTIYRACRRAGRKLVLSSYTGRILMCVENEHLPSFLFPDVKRFNAIAEKPHHVTPDMIAAAPNEYVIFLVHKIFQALRDTDLINADASFIYSMWDGYKADNQEKLDYLQSRGVHMTDIHTSGHADIPALQSFVRAASPRRLIPMHTFHPDRFRELFGAAEIHGDNEEFEI